MTGCGIGRCVEPSPSPQCSKGPQLRPTEQRKRLQRYLRTLRANYNRAYREVPKIFRIRKGCPFEHALRHRRFEQANGLLKLAEACLKEINHCYAHRLAPFRPGDQLLVKVTMPGYEREPQRYLVLDLEWRKRDEYTYIVHELTKSGTLHKGRYPTWLTPSNRISIELCEEPLPDETQSRARSARDATANLMESVLNEGRLSMFERPKAPAAPPPRQQYPFWTGRP